MIRVIAESGATKTDWVILDADKIISRHHSSGFNPFLESRERLDAILFDELTASVDEVDEVFYYGAGCSTEDNKTMVAEALSRRFNVAHVEVNTDIMAAARAVAGNDKSIVGILGTGANACLYDGNTIIAKAPSLGYILGDEGSGSYIGKMLLHSYFYNKMPKDLRDSFRETYPIQLHEVLNNIYGKERPSKYLGEFAMFAAAHQSHPFIAALCEKAFEQYIELFIEPLMTNASLTINMVGSVSFYFQELLRHSFNERHISVGTIVKDPSQGLIDYHCKRR